MQKIKTVLNWSSGKDAALAYYLLQQSNEYDVVELLTTVNNEHDRVVMHGIREELLDAQAKAMGIALQKIKLPAAPDDETYKAAMQHALAGLKEKGMHTAAFGDIFLEDLRLYREEQLQSVGFDAIFPLWKKDTRELVGMIEDAGIETMIVCLNEKFLGKEFLGRKIDRHFLNDLPAGVDPCGEHGEFHTFVYNAPYFSAPVPVKRGEEVYKAYTPANNDTDKWNTGFWFLDLTLDT
ncbi:MAG: diphthine--ammonia ligase [Bacteroidetes bacterium]|nr:diphthine--ammonia ligase [Bacteroidota bacterium]